MRILYVGNDLDLLKFSHETLEGKVVRCPPGSTARSFIKGINYNLFLLDESERELVDFIRLVGMHEQTPIVMVSKLAFEEVVEAMEKALLERRAEV